MKLVSIVIGLYNSEATILDVLAEIDEAFRGVDEYAYEVILVDDCSPDGVYRLVCDHAATDRRIKVIHLAKNAGQTNAVMEGYRFATGDYVVEMDDDYQMPAYEIPKMVRALEGGDYDVVFARYRSKKESPFRLFGSKVNSLMAEGMLGKPRDITINSFFVMRRFVAQAMVAYANNYPYLYGNIFAVTRNVANIDVDHRPRTSGSSNYTLRSLLGLWANGFLNYSVTPLRVSMYLGFAITCISFVIAVILVVQRLFGPTQSLGWTSLIVTIIFFAGVQLMSLGVLGEYIGRLFLSSSGLPRAIVRDTVNVSEREERHHEPSKS